MGPSHVTFIKQMRCASLIYNIYIKDAHRICLMKVTYNIYILRRINVCCQYIKYRSWQILQIMSTMRKKSLFYQMLF